MPFRPSRRWLFQAAEICLLLGASLPARAETPTPAEIGDRVADVFAAFMNVPPQSLDRTASFDQLGVSDLDDLGDILTHVEIEFGLDIPVDIMTSFTTMDDVIRYVIDALTSGNA